MDTEDIKDKLIAIGEKVKAKGWTSAHIDIFVQYLAIFDREPGLLDPMLTYRPCLQVSFRNRFGHPQPSKDMVRDGYDCKTLDAAMAKLEETADAMPTMTEELANYESARSKLSDEDKRLLGIFP